RKTGWNGNGLLLSDVLGRVSNVVKRIEEQVYRSLLACALAQLSSREKTIMRLRFGLDNGGEQKTQKEVADLLGISQSYISRLEKRILRKLRLEIQRLE